ncbi:MAG: aldo/keto reductase [Candidatus Brocadiia bacterium]
MNYVRFGNAGIEVSRLCLGCMDFPLRLEQAEAARVLDAALDHGVNFLDTADAYGRGRSEEALGRLLGDRRQRVILATKFWVKMGEGPNTGGCSRLHILRACEASLRRLDTDYIDLYQLHHPDPRTPAEEVLAALDTLVRQGKVRYVGVCNHYAWQVAHLLGTAALGGWEPPCSLQCRYNLLDRAVETETMPFCRRFRVATMIYGPLDRGILTGKYRRGEEPPEGSFLARSPRFRRRLSPEVFDLLDELRAIAAKYDAGLNQLAAAWLLARPGVTSVILGGSRPEHFAQLYGVEELELEGQDVARMDELSEPWRYRPFVNQPIVEGPPPARHRW